MSSNGGRRRGLFQVSLVRTLFSLMRTLSCDLMTFQRPQILISGSWISTQEFLGKSHIQTIAMAVTYGSLRSLLA